MSPSFRNCELDKPFLYKVVFLSTFHYSCRKWTNTTNNLVSYPMLLGRKPLAPTRLVLSVETYWSPWNFLVDCSSMTHGRTFVAEAPENTEIPLLVPGVQWQRKQPLLRPTCADGSGVARVGILALERDLLSWQWASASFSVLYPKNSHFLVLKSK